MKKRGQVTIFLIIGIVLLAVVVIFFFLNKQDILNPNQIEVNQKEFLQTCMEERITETVNLIAIQGGSINPTLKKTYDLEDGLGKKNISILCYNQNFYTPCINQEPMLVNHVREEIEKNISQDVKQCFDDLVISLNKKGFETSALYKGFEIKLQPDKVILEIYGEITTTRTDETKKEKDFEIIVKSKFYNLVIVAQEIISQEARFCHFENLGYMLFYKNFNIDKFKTGDFYIFYTVEDRDSQEKFRFAIRGCAIPPGI